MRAHGDHQNEESSTYDLAVPAFVLRIGQYPLHAGSLGIVRSLGRLGIPVYGVYESRFSPAATSKYLAGRFIWPTEPRDADLLLKGILAIAAVIGKPAVLIPTDDFGAILISEHANALEQAFLFPRQPAGLPRQLANRKELYLLCRRLGVGCADTAFSDSPAELEDLIARAGFPLVSKVVEPWKSRPGARLLNTRLLRSREEVRAVLDAARNADALPILFQEVIPGRGADWFFHGYSNAESVCVASFTGRKYRSYPPHAGRTAYCRSEENEELRATAEHLIRAISYRGIMDLDWRFDVRDGRYKLLDFNPRIGAQFRLFENANGIDVVRAMHLDLTGRHVLPAPTRQRSFMVEDLDLGALAAYRRAGETDFATWLDDARGASEFGWFARDDLLPFCAMVLGQVRNLAAKKLGWGARPGPNLLMAEPQYHSGRLA